MVFVRAHAADLSQPAITNVEEFVTERSPVILAVCPAKSVAVIQSAARSVLNPVHRALSYVLGPAPIGSVVQCLALYHAT